VYVYKMECFVLQCEPPFPRSEYSYNTLSRINVVQPFKMIVRKGEEILVLQHSLLPDLLVALYLISDLEVFPAIKRNAAIGVLAHLIDVFLLVFER
jgi:hypothetical protein